MKIFLYLIQFRSDLDKIEIGSKKQSDHTGMPLIYEEVRRDLFAVPSNVSLAHCVSQDLQMSKGIAKLFRDKFRQVDVLKKQSLIFKNYSSNFQICS